MPNTKNAKYKNAKYKNAKSKKKLIELIDRFITNWLNQTDQIMNNIDALVRKEFQRAKVMKIPYDRDDDALIADIRFIIENSKDYDFNKTMFREQFSTMNTEYKQYHIFMLDLYTKYSKATVCKLCRSIGTNSRTCPMNSKAKNPCHQSHYRYDMDTGTGIEEMFGEMSI